MNFDGVGPWNRAPKNPEDTPSGYGPWTNTIDSGTPSSQVDTLPQYQTSTTLSVLSQLLMAHQAIKLPAH
ncbi:MAG: hypothetical protein ABH886_06560 [Candidatus Desantisbacteria bacterium]